MVNTGRRTTSGNHTLWGAALAVLALCCVALLNLACAPSENSRRTRFPRGSAGYSVEMITILLVSEQMSNVSRTWPPYTGKNFVLSAAVAWGLGKRRRDDLAILFGPDGIPEGIDGASYEGVTRESLRTTRFPHLTDLAGRAAPITEADQRDGTPLVALADGNTVVIGYSNGDVRRHDRDDLGLDDDDPIIFGPESQSPLLRLLSDK